MIFKPTQKKLMVWADPERVKEMMVNILNNGIKYNKTNGTVIISVSRKDNRVEVSVKDTGIGLEPPEMKRLFGKFYRAENKYTKNITGTGLGLYITKQMASLMNGKIWAQSPGHDKGTTITFALPLTKTS